MYPNIREEELKNKIAQDYFWLYDCTKIIGNLDFCVAMLQGETSPDEHESLLWAEAKKGESDVQKSIVQLILTIGKARTFDKFLPPPFLGAFDGEKMAFIPYSEIIDVFYKNDFNWNVAPSNHETREFKLVLELVRTVLDTKSLIFYYEKDDKELKKFISDNFIVGKFGVTKTKIDKNNFMVVYNKWLQEVKPTIAVNWDIAKKNGIIDGDFYLADLLSDNNQSLKDSLYVLLKNDHYQSARKINDMGMFDASSSHFVDKQIAHTQFWNRYDRPPKQIYWDYIVERRDLLVPQDVRERKGSYFTPQIWVELSQQYLTDALGENWQDDYYIWDCACGTGNLLAGLTNKYNIYASTLDRQDIDVIKDRIKNGANLLENHVFQFDFLNDEFFPSKGGAGSKLPQDLQDIINDPEKRKKLLIYINPPYAEATDGIGQGGKKIDVSKETKMYGRYGAILKKAKNELFAQFLIRILRELPEVKIAQFSTLKILQSSNFVDFRGVFNVKLEKIFIVPANTFDNVKGAFPIGFMIWDTQKKELFEKIEANVYKESGKQFFEKTIYSYHNNKYINEWIKEYINIENNFIGYLAYLGNDFQHIGEVRFTNKKPTSHISTVGLNYYNVMPLCTYFAVRHCIAATWLNDRDQFLFPTDGWEADNEFQNNCLAFSLFDGQNKITSQDSTNHWIPFTEYEVDAKERFESNFMSKYIAGKLKSQLNGNLFSSEKERTTPLIFSVEATAVFEAGKALWTYYHAQKFFSFGGVYEARGGYNPNASLYDIRAYFQGRNPTGKMNLKSPDETYTALIADLREKLKELAQKIEPKVYEYGFLKA